MPDRAGCIVTYPSTSVYVLIFPTKNFDALLPEISNNALLTKSNTEEPYTESLLLSFTCLKEGDDLVKLKPVMRITITAADATALRINDPDNNDDLSWARVLIPRGEEGVVGVVVVLLELVCEGLSKDDFDRGEVVLLFEGVVGDCRINDDDSDRGEDDVFILDGRRGVTGSFSGKNDDILRKVAKTLTDWLITVHTECF